ncbi:MAG: T9SS type A sorting domain-containing protein, partial [Ferruginibacter sp.]|nr:T9SS type A sorting domain-containing protein [Chitinophagaceae bacterium]
YRVNASSPWLTVTNGGVYSGATTATLTLTNVPASMTGYQYRALISGPCTAIDFSNVASLTITPLVASVTPTAATICTGTIQQLTLTNAASPSTQTFTAAAGLPAAIPDASLAGINNSIAVALPAGSIISNVAVRFSIPAHTWAGDLVVVLRAPNNQILNLDYGVTGTGVGPTLGGAFVNTVISSSGTAALSSGTAPFTGTFRADAQLLPTAGMGNAPTGPGGFTPTTATWLPLYTTPSGNWTLAIYDAFAGDVGSLTAWSLDITYGAPAAGVWTSSPAAPNTMFTNSLATVPYVAGTPVNTIWVNPTVNTSYSVVYTTATPCVSGPTVIPITVINPVSAVVNPVNRAACIGGSATFTVGAGGGPNTFQWQVSTDGGVNWVNVAGATSSSLTVSGVTALMNNNRYRVVITAAPCAGSVTSGFATLTVNPLPTVTISSPDVSIIPGQITTITATSSPAAASATSYTWTLDGAAISGTTNTQSVGIDRLGVYQARVTDVNGCVNVSNSLTIGAEASDRLWIYPNPSPGAFQVRLFHSGALTEKRVVSVFKANGQLVAKKEFTLDNVSNPYLRMDFDLSHLAAGTYVVKVHNSFTGQIVSGLVMIQHD